jgi:hypothetical protein
MFKARVNDNCTALEFVNEWLDMGPLSAGEHSAVVLLLGSFIWFDILAAASTGLKPFLKINHQLVLSSNSIHLEELIGCENWVVILIFQINELVSWKKEAETNGRLSIPELAKRGARIEHVLQEKSNELFLRISDGSGPSISGMWGRFPKSASSEITRIFILSALTYLHVVISGPNPELPEIASNVTRAIEAFESLTHPPLLRYLVWPFCITGCLASEQQRRVFPALIATAEINGQTLSSCRRAFKIMEECWKLRNTHPHQNYDWISTMKSLDHVVLLG